MRCRRWFAARSIMAVAVVIAVSAHGETRPFLKGCGRFKSTWASRPRSYDTQIWDRMAAIGVTITGCDSTWVDIEPTKGSYNAAALDYADFEVNEIRGRGIEPVMFLGLTPQWAKLRPDLPPHRTPPAEDYVREFEDFHTFIANRYKGKVRYYFFWNEPNGCSWVNDGCSNGSEYALYTRWLIRCSEAVKAADPDAKIIGARIDYHAGVTHGYQYVEGMYDNGAGPHIDGVAIHPYNWAGTLHWQALTDTRAAMVSRGYPEHELWLTEYGWNTTDRDLQAERLTEVLEELHKPQWSFVTMANYLVLNDGAGVENYGLMDANLNPRPAYYAFRDFQPPAPPSGALQNASFEEGIGALTGWYISSIAGEGPDLPALNNTNPYGPRTPFGDRFGGKVTSWLGMNFRLGQILAVADPSPSRARIDWTFSAHVNLHCRHNDGVAYPENMHQVWEIGWNNDGSMPADIDSCDNYREIASVDGSFSGNDPAGFYPLEAQGSLPNVGGVEYVVLRVHMYNDVAREWSMVNADNIAFTATAVGLATGSLSTF